jgi:purine-binding chemotaxis protein CheW
MTTDLLLFRVGRELFATTLAAVEEAIDLTSVEALTHLPGVDSPARGVFTLRGTLIPLFSPSGALGVAPETAETALIVGAGGRRIALVVDDAEDVLTVTPSELRPLPAGDGRDAGIVRGIVRRGAVLVTVVDLDAVVAACRGAPEPEGA